MRRGLEVIALSNRTRVQKRQAASATGIAAGCHVALTLSRVRRRTDDPLSERDEPGTLGEPATQSEPPLLALQRSAGNRAVSSALARGRAASRQARGRDPQTVGDRTLAAELATSSAGRSVMRTIGDGHDLTSPRFSLIEDLEAAFDGERSVKLHDTGRGVQAIQQCLYDIGFGTPAHGADGKFGSETKTAVKAYQAANPPLVDDGKVGKDTMAALDARFAAFTLPPAASRSAPWTPAGVKPILGPWSPHTLQVLETRITLKSFDDISWADEEWDGSSWTPAPFPGGGYNTGTEIGVLNSTNEEMAETLYHEVLHAEQPTSHRTTLQKESYAYRIGEEFSIAAGLTGRSDLRSTDAQGREFADPAKVDAMVATEYPSVPASGANEEIIGKGATMGEVQVEKADGTVYTRAAAIGERVPGPMTTTNEVTHPATDWTYP
jgi:peptidoglycan hydrolase-like protein with peptidoglycan-binding domain